MKSSVLFFGRQPFFYSRVRPPAALRSGILILLLAASSSVLANMRGPQFLNTSAAANLQKPGGQVVVQKENLTFSCTRIQIDAPLDPCTIRAVYTVQAFRSSTISLQFVLSERATQIKARLAGQSRPIQLQLPASDQHDRPGMDRQATAIFQGPLPAGTHEIVVEYRQPVGLQEYGYGYFSDGKFTAWLDFELWPLKEWQLAPDFQLELTVHAGVKPGWWQRLTAPATGLVVYQSTRDAQQQQTVSMQSDPAAPYYWYTKTWDRNFPDRLRIVMGELERIQ
ncbi:MAG: hypothetical protein KDK39_15315 [Leptospiraceae bacterium]|nr:hypothetical protein [Leptospiraceae bacterium]